MTAIELYRDTIKPLPENERLQLAALILNDIAGICVDTRDEWTQEDMQEFINAALQQFEEEHADGEKA